MKIKFLILPLLFFTVISCGGSGNRNSQNISSEIHSESQNLDSLPNISTLEKTYLNFDSYDNYKIILENVDSIAVLHYDGKVVDTKLYIFNDQTHELIVSNDYIVNIGYGKHIISINKTIHYCVIVYDNREPILTGESTFKYLGQKHPTFEFALFGAELTSFKNNDTSYIEYTSINNNNLIINGSLCEKFISLKLFGNQEFNVEFTQYLPSGDNIFSFKLTIYIPTQGSTIIK